jgi:hypothetical protein
MGLKKAFVPLAMTIGFGVATAYAVNEVGELNLNADKIESCLRADGTTLSYCFEYPMSATEVDTLRNTAHTTGALGWLAFGAKVSSGFLAAELTRKKD